MITFVCYGNATLLGLCKNKCQLLQNVLNAGSWLIFLAKYHDRITPLLKLLKWEGPWTHHLLNHQHDKLIAWLVVSSEIIQTYIIPECSHLHSAAYVALVVQHAITKAENRAFYVITPKSWSKLVFNVGCYYLSFSGFCQTCPSCIVPKVILQYIVPSTHGLNHWWYSPDGDPYFWRSHLLYPVEAGKSDFRRGCLKTENT